MVLINQDLNHCILSSSLSSFKQFLTCPTRNNNSIDLFYWNVKDSFLCRALSSLGQSDHNLILLTAKYTPLVRRQHVSIKSVRVWSHDACEELRAWFELTDCFRKRTMIWTIYQIWSPVICIFVLILLSHVKHFPNNKPWVPSEVKAAINKKATCHGPWNVEDQVKATQKELRTIIRQGRRNHNQMVEGHLSHSNTSNARGLWKGMELITGHASSSAGPQDSFINLKDKFFCQVWWAWLFSSPWKCLFYPVRENDCFWLTIVIGVNEVCHQLRCLKANKRCDTWWCHTYFPCLCLCPKYQPCGGHHVYFPRNLLLVNTKIWSL